MLTPLACAVSLAEEEDQIATNGGSSPYDAGGEAGFGGSSGGSGWASTGGVSGYAGTAGQTSAGGFGGIPTGGTGGATGCAPGTVQNLGTCELCGTETRTCD